MTGAVTGIYGYRRVSAAGRRVSATLRPGKSAPRRKVTPARLAREACRFARDVREGMDLYMVRHDKPAGSTLTTDREARHEDGR
jgi:hypothetical protein